MDETPPPKRRRAPVIVISAALTAVVVVVGVLWATRSSDHNHSAAEPPPSAHAASPSETASETATGTAQPKPAAATKPKPVPHDVVAAAAPSTFAFTGASFSIRAHVCGMEYIRPLDPPGEQHHTVCWVQHDFGYAPASNGRGTTYVLGHAWGQDSLEVLNKISETAMRQVLPLRARGKTTDVSGIPTYPVTKLNGYVVTLRTPTGVLRYTVKRAYAVAKPQAGDITSLMAEQTRNRVVIITCGELDHVDYDYNIVVEAYLTSSVATSAQT
jgi:hypothetical protein